MEVSINKKFITSPQRGIPETSVIVTYSGSGIYNDPIISYEGEQENWLSVEYLGEVTQNVVEYKITILPYVMVEDEKITRVAEITFSDNVGSGSIKVYQANGYLPIWQNYNYVPTTTGNITYELKKGDDTIFKGVAVSDVPSKVNIPRLCESSIFTNTYSENSGWNDLNGRSIIDFYLDGNFEDTYYFYNDWSGERLIYNIDIILNEPINGHLAANMIVPLCVYNASDNGDYIIGFFDEGGSVDEIECGNPDFDFSSYTFSVGTGLTGIEISNQGETELKYDASHCGEGYFTYRNRYGAWDVFLIEGNIYEYEDYVKAEYENLNTDNRKDTWGRITNSIEIQKRYGVYTGWLSDEESKRLVYHLLSSPEVYYNTFDGKRIAVNITNNSSEIKKFRNGRKLIQYEILFSESKKAKINR